MSDEHQAIIRIKYEGPILEEGFISADDLAQALSGASALIQQISHEDDVEDGGVVIQVKSLERGSSIIDLIAIAFAKHLLVHIDQKYQLTEKIVNAFESPLKAAHKIRGRKVKRIQEGPKVGQKEYIFSDDDGEDADSVVLTREEHDAIQNSEVRKGLKNMIGERLHEKGLESLSVEALDGKESREIAKIPHKEAGWFRDNLDDNIIEKRYETHSGVLMEVLSSNFEGEGSLWHLKYIERDKKGNKIHARMRDAKFVDGIHKGECFFQEGDTLLCTIRTTIPLAKHKNREYEILSVSNLKHRRDPPSLPLEAPDPPERVKKKPPKKK